MQKDLYDRIISFLQGASWGIIIFGALVTFKISVVFGLSLAIFFTTLFIFITLFLVLALDAFSVNKQKLSEAKKQTELLEKIYFENTNNRS